MKKKIKKISEVKDIINAIQTISKYPAIINLARNYHPSKEKRNPYNIEEKERLLQKYSDNTLTLEEAKRLQEILKEDLSHAKDDVLTAIAIGLLLIGVAVLIAYLLDKEK